MRVQKQPLSLRLALAIVPAVLSVCCFISNLSAQSRAGNWVIDLIHPLDAPIRVGGGLTGNINFHSLNVPIYNGSTYCGTFTSGTSVLPGGFITLEYPLERSEFTNWYFAPRIDLHSMGASMTTDAVDQERVRNPVDSSLVSSTRVHKLDASVLAAGLKLFAKYRFTKSFSLFAGPGLSYLITRSMDQTESITSPAGAVFVKENSNIRSLYSGQIPNSRSILFSGTLGAMMDIPVSEKVEISPELSFTFPFQSLRSDYSWKVYTLSLGAAVKFDISPNPAPPTVTSEPLPPAGFAGTVKLLGLTKDAAGNTMEIPSPQIQIEEFERHAAYPMLNVVFFGEGASTVPARYIPLSRDGADVLNPNSFAGKSSLEVYHNVLNILGARLRADPKVSITLTGANANAGVEKDNVALSKARAEAVKDYFVTRFGIAPERIRTEARDLPQSPSPIETNEGQAENRRVEITSDNPTFLDPLELENIERTMNPPILRVKTQVTSQLPLADTRVRIIQSGNVLHDFGAAKPVQDWTPSASEMPSTESNLVAELYAKNDRGNVQRFTDSTQVRQLTIRKKIEQHVKDLVESRYDLITFDFDKAQLDTRSERIIHEIVSTLQPGDSITIAGYTDLTGERVHNLKLSEDRAQNVRTRMSSELQARVQGVKFATFGRGENNLVDNALPEGRFLSRTVAVIVDRPLTGQ